MKSLRIVRAKPNPSGKDRYRGVPPPAQLGGEWVDLSNAGNEPFPLGEITLYHIAYQPSCKNGRWDPLSNFRGSLSRGQIIRIHSGWQLPTSEMHPEDARGADYHLFTNRGYVWNNDCSDTAALSRNGTWLDSATYDPYPPEGRILIRLGDRLIPSI